MRLEDYQKKVFKDYQGFYDRGENDQVPENHFSDALNLDYDIGEWKTRAGLSGAITLGYGSGSGRVNRFAGFADPTIGYVILILDNAGNLYTFSPRTGDTATSVRLAMGSSAVDFSAVKMLGKIYLGFHNGITGLSGVNLKVFIPHATTPGSDEFRDAAGLAPTASGAMGASDSGTSGNVNAGIYKIAVAYETTSGFITVPGPEVSSVFTPTSFTATGSERINMTSIPTGPSGTAKRHILITKAGLLKYFFVVSANGGIIADNTTTTTTLNFDDTVDLIASADFLFDQLTTIPAPLALQNYNGKLCTLGEGAEPSIMRVSLNGEPESFDKVDGIVNIAKDDGFTLKNVVVFSKILYAWKNLGVYSIIDNGAIPTTWIPNPIDLNVNVGIHGIAEFFDLSSIRMARDWTLLADRSGILFFNGIVQKPPITDKINDLWQTINENKYHLIVLVVDERLHKIYCAFPTGSNTDNDTFIVGDYNSCPGKFPEFSRIKWSKWEMKPTGSLINISEIGFFGVGDADTVPTLKIGTADAGGKIWKLDDSQTADDGTAIESFFETALLFWQPGNIHFFVAARMRIIGSGTLLITIRDLDNVNSGTLPSVTLATSPGEEKLVRFTFQGEKVRLKFRLTSGYFIVSKLEVFGKSVYQMRPA